MARRDLVRVTSSMGGIPLGEFRTISQVEITSAEIKTVAGAGQTERARGGRKSVGNITIAREDDGSLHYLKDLVGRSGMVITRTPLDDDGNPLSARARTATGALVACRFGEGDAQADDDLDDIELEMSADNVIA